MDAINNPIVPPQALAAEESVIGGCLIDAGAVDRLAGLLSVDDFYLQVHKIIFNAILQLSATGSAIDVLLVDEYLQGKGLSAKVGGLAALGTMAKNTPTAANITHYAAIVREKSILRSVISTAQEMLAKALDTGADAKSVISHAEKEIFGLGQQGLRGRRGFVAIREALGAVIDEMERLHDAPPSNGVRGQSSGFKDLDDMTSGNAAGDLILVAARPSMGKTAFSMNIAEHIATIDKKPVAVFSMEMTKEQIAQRLLVSSSGLAMQRAKKPWTLQDDDWTLLSAGLSKLADAPIYVDDTPDLTISALRSRLMRLVSELSDEYPGGLGAVVVDYIQLMNVDGAGNDNRNGQIEVISRGLKQLAKELSVPVFALSQLNRNLDSRPNKRPVMSDLRDSGALEQDADVILFLYRDEVYHPDSPDKGVAEVIIGKQRNGPLGVVRLGFDGACTRFRDWFGGYAGEGDY